MRLAKALRLIMINWLRFKGMHVWVKAKVYKVSEHREFLCETTYHVYKGFVACGELEKVPYNVLQVLGDRYSLIILLEAIKRPICAPKLVELGIPPATAYRRLEILRRMGLLERRGFTATGRGRWAFCYVARFKSITIRISGDGVEVRVDGERGVVAKKEVKGLESCLA